MTVFADATSPELVDMIIDGAVGLLLTDTLYGLVAVSNNRDAVERVYRIKQRTPTKSPIILIGDISQLYDSLPGVDSTLPDDAGLRKLLQQTGPLIAPSANPEGDPPAMTIAKAREYFGDTVDFYVDGGIVADDQPSRLYRYIDDTHYERLR
ncbi:MAG: hypothetical protein EOO17_02065 [Chloroflexi bacterium]|nr:MAG: hypothetical protein EOO17_02065 [Chloroflexota bacterium]